VSRTDSGYEHLFAEYTSVPKKITSELAKLCAGALPEPSPTFALEDISDGGALSFVAGLVDGEVAVNELPLMPGQSLTRFNLIGQID